LGYNRKGCYKDKGENNEFILNDCIGNYEEEPNYADYEPTDLTSIIFIVLIIAVLILGLIVFVKYGYPWIKEKKIAQAKTLQDKKLEKADEPEN
jgi:hypothetical protein